MRKLRDPINNRKVIDYKVYKWDFVTDRLAEGWELYGSPMIVNDLASQAMVKYEEKREPRLGEEYI